MQQLNLPSFDYKIREIDGKAAIFDILRKRYIVLTPEEWVRQHFIHFLITHYQYPKSLIKIESGHKYNQLQKRSDIIVYDRYGKVFLLVECKSADIAISQKVFEQAALYNQSLNARHLAVTNGLNHFVCSVDYENKDYKFLKDIPLFDLNQ
jgi:hypothetical protein